MNKGERAGNSPIGVNVVEGKSENWATTTRSLIFDTFDSGRLSRTFTDTTLNRNFITSTSCTLC